MTPCTHAGEARQSVLKKLESLEVGEVGVERILLIDDLFGKLRLVVWPAKSVSPTDAPSIGPKLDNLMKEAAGAFWSGESWIANSNSKSDQLVYDGAWDEAHPLPKNPRVRINDRYRNRGGWFTDFVEPPWPCRGPTQGPPILVFYSFKGGVGRTTALAAFAVHRARAGESVAVIDFDLDAPGAGVLLSSGNSSEMASHGVVDYLLDCQVVESPDLRDYYHRYGPEGIAGNIYVIPSGRLDDDYLGQLAKLDLEPPVPGDEMSKPEPFVRLLNQVRTELSPDWILIDARSGLSNAAGFLLRGMAHLHVLFGIQSEQSWLGIRRLLNRLGESRVRQVKPQLDCLIAQGMVCDNSQISEESRQLFLDRSLEEFTDHYYAEDQDDPTDDDLWCVSDSQTEDAPHVPVAIHYTQRLALFSRLDEVWQDLLASSDYAALVQRIVDRFGAGSSDQNEE